MQIFKLPIFILLTIIASSLPIIHKAGLIPPTNHASHQPTMPLGMKLHRSISYLEDLHKLESFGKQIAPKEGSASSKTLSGAELSIDALKNVQSDASLTTFANSVSRMDDSTRSNSFEVLDRISHFLSLPDETKLLSALPTTIVPFQWIFELKYDPDSTIYVGKDIWWKRKDGQVVTYQLQQVGFHKSYMAIWAVERIGSNSGSGATYPVVITVFKKSINGHGEKLYQKLLNHYRFGYELKHELEPRGLIMFSDDDKMIAVGPTYAYLDFLNRFNKNKF